MDITALKKGDRVQLHPATDWWMRGTRYGEVEGVSRGIVFVRLDRLGGLYAFFAQDILEVI